MLQFIQHAQKDFLSCYLDDTPWPLGVLQLPHVQIQVLAQGIMAFRPVRETENTNTEEPIKVQVAEQLDAWQGYPSMVLSAGVHGDETAPIECLALMVQDILSERLLLDMPCLFIFAHAKATQAHVRYFDQNLNRLFKEPKLETLSSNQSNQELVIANRIKTALADFYATTDSSMRWHFDLHCSIRPSRYPLFAISPAPIDSKRTQRLHQALAKLGLDAVVLSKQPSSTLSWFSHAYYEAHAATVELGKLKPLRQNNLNDLAHFDQCIRAWLMDHQFDYRQEQPHKTRYFEATKVIDNQNQIQFSALEDLTNFNRLPTHKPFAHDGDISYQANEGEVILFANQSVEVGQRAALIAKPLQDSTPRDCNQS